MGDKEDCSALCFRKRTDWGFYSVTAARRGAGISVYRSLDRPEEEVLVTQVRDAPEPCEDEVSRGRLDKFLFCVPGGNSYSLEYGIMEVPKKTK